MGRERERRGGHGVNEAAEDWNSRHRGDRGA